MDIEEEEAIVSAAKENRFLTSKDIEQDEDLNSKGVTDRTIRYILSKNDLHGRRAPTGFNIKEVNKLKRIEFSKMMLQKSEQEKLSICYSDESYLSASRFQIQYVRRYDNEILEPEYWNLKDRWSGGLRCFVWALISYDGPLKLTFIDSTLNKEGYLEVLKKEIGRMTSFKSKRIFMQDNASCHSAKIVE